MISQINKYGARIALCLIVCCALTAFAACKKASTASSPASYPVLEPPEPAFPEMYFSEQGARAMVGKEIVSKEYFPKLGLPKGAFGEIIDIVPLGGRPLHFSLLINVATLTKTREKFQISKTAFDEIFEIHEPSIISHGDDETGGKR